MQQKQIQEMVRKRVSKCGTGAVAYAPKKWIGKEVILVLPKEEERSVEEKVLDALGPHLSKIQGIFLYGSYARNEQTSDSDIDVMVIASEPFKIREEGMEFIVISDELLVEKMKSNPIEYYPMVQEAKSILNEELLQELKKTKIEKDKLLWVKHSAKKPLKYVEELIEVDKKRESKHLSSPAVIYSLFLRARGAHIAKAILEKKKYSSKQFKKHLIKKGISQDLYKRLYSMYASERDDKKSEVKITLVETERLLRIVKGELKALEEKINGQQEKNQKSS